MTTTTHAYNANAQGWETQGKPVLVEEDDDNRFEENELALTEAGTHHPPEYTRSPRHYLRYPDEEIKLDPPPQKPNQPVTSIVSILLPAIGVIMSIAVAVFAQSSGTGGIPVYAFVSAPVMLLSISFGIWNWRQARKKYENEIGLRKQIYTQYLQEQRAHLDELATKQRKASLEPNPAPEECEERAKKSLQSDEANPNKSGSLLWEREPGQPDFLHLRLGLGLQRCTFRVEEPPKQPMSLFKDELLLDGKKLAADFQQLEKLPVLLKLNELGFVGIIGDRTEDQFGHARALLMQIATNHAPSEVKIVLVSRKQDSAQWRWARWLPHMWSDDRKGRYFLSNRPKTAASARRTILNEFESILQQRRMQAEDRQNTDGTLPQPVYIFVFTDRQVWSGPSAALYGPFLDLLFREGRKLGAYAIFLAGRRSRVPKGCGAVIELRHNVAKNETTAELEIVGPVPVLEEFIPDCADTKTAVCLTNVIAPVRLEQVIASEQIPARATLADAFGVEKISDVNVRALWDEPLKQPWVTLYTPLGLKAGGKLAEVNLQQAGVPPVFTLTNDGQKIEHPAGFGAHAMIGGTTGTGKTKFLQTLIVSMCAHYSPEALSFVLIDYKGGDLAKGLETLPHLVGSLANVDGQGRQTELIQRLFTSIDVEILRRKNLLKGRQINEYLTARKDTGEPALPHLFIVIDEFAEMIQKNPSDDPNKNIMKRLLSIAAIGRSIGIHLILATQNPGTVVGEDLRNNITTRICLRMGTRDASKAMLNRNDAFENISKDQVGRAYVQVGNNDVFEMIQVAYGGSPDIPPGEIPPWEVNRVTDWGERLKRRDENYKKTKYNEQIETLVTMLAAAGADLPKQRPIWLPLLPEKICLFLTDEDHKLEPKTDEEPLAVINLSRAAGGWNGSGWDPVENRVSPIIGLYDYPSNREQDTLRLNLEKEGHLLVYGGPGSGKTTLLQSIILNLTLDLAPDDLNLYLIDFGGRNLNIFSHLPHVGAVINSSEGERVHRLLLYLGAELSRRREKMEGVKTISEYRAQTGEKIPDIVIVIDNLSAYLEMARAITAVVNIELDTLIQLAGEGAAYGFHLILASNTTNKIPTTLTEKIGLVISYHLEDPRNYLDAIGRTGGLFLADIPGRGLVRLTSIFEFQTALPGASHLSDFQRVERMKRIALEMSEAWEGKECAFAIPMMEKIWTGPTQLGIGLSPSEEVGSRFIVTLGRNIQKPDLRPVAVSLEWGPHFWVCGSGSSGKTTFLQTWLLSLANRYSPTQLRFYLVDPEESGICQLANLPHTINCLVDEELIKTRDILNEIDQDLQNSPGEPHVVVALDDIANIKQLGDRTPLYTYLRSVMLDKKQTNIHVIAAGGITSKDFSSTSTFDEGFRKLKTGFMIGVNDSSFMSSFNIKAMADAPKQISPGHAFYFRRKEPCQLVQLAICQPTPLEFEKLHKKNS